MPVDMKAVIADTYMDLVRRGNVDKITVKALIEACHISRQTFYYHFRDILDVLEWSFHREILLLVDQSLEAGNLTDTLKIFIRFMVKGFPLLQKLLNSQKRTQLEQNVISSLEIYLRELERHRNSHVALSSADREVLLRYNAYGLAGILLEYCGRDNLDEQLLATQLERILSGEMLGWEQK